MDNSAFSKKLLIVPFKGKEKTPKLDIIEHAKPLEKLMLFVNNNNNQLAYDDNNLYSSKSHKEYCKQNPKKRATLVTTLDPRMSLKLSVTFPIKYLVHRSIVALDNKKPQFQHLLYEDVTMDASFNNFNYPFLAKHSITNNLRNLPIEWIGKQMKYIESLPMRDVYSLRGYSYLGDGIANSTLKQSPKFMNSGRERKIIQDEFPFYFQAESVIGNAKNMNEMFNDSSVNTKIMFNSNAKKTHDVFTKATTIKELIAFCQSKWSGLKRSVRFYLISHLWEHFVKDIHFKIVSLFIHDLERIINNAPPLLHDTNVYRGVKNDYYLTGSKNNVYQNVGFVSTSLDVSTALNFLALDGKCCLQQITALKGTKAILLMPVSVFVNEKEVLFNHSSIYYVKKSFVKKSFYMDPEFLEEDMCFDKELLQRTKVSEIILS